MNPEIGTSLTGCKRKKKQKERIYVVMNAVKFLELFVISSHPPLQSLFF